MDTTAFCHGLFVAQFARKSHGQATPADVDKQVAYLKSYLPSFELEISHLVQKIESSPSPTDYEKTLLKGAPKDIADGIQAAGGALKLLTDAPHIMNGAIQSLQTPEVLQSARASVGSQPVSAAGCVHWLLIWLMCAGTGPLAGACGLGAAFGYAQCKLG
jgi:hypothetical protein